MKPLNDAFHDDDRRQVATELLIEFARDDPDTLVRLNLDAEPRSYGPLIEALKPHGLRAQKALGAVLAESMLPKWDDPPLDPPWSQPDPALEKVFGEADGMIGERFAFCQSIILDDFITLGGRLRVAGYRPTRVRPYLDGHTIRVAAIWTRDGRDWQ